jgi:hypothetical protein
MYFDEECELDLIFIEKLGFGLKASVREFATEWGRPTVKPRTKNHLQPHVS